MTARALASLALAGSVGACGGQTHAAIQREATGGEAPVEMGGTSGGVVNGGGAGAGGGGASGGVAGAADGSSGSCASEGPQYGYVSGTVRGAWVDAVILENQLTSVFLGPQSGFREYSQTFRRASDGAGGARGDLEFRAPSDVVTASLTGWVGADAAEVGSYSERDCGSLTFEMAFPIPPGIVCPSEPGRCGPDCEPYGELGLCVPASPKVRFEAESVCDEGAPPARGSWQLELSSVCPEPSPAPFVHFRTHGHLTATLLNETDPSDSVELSLDF